MKTTYTFHVIGEQQVHEGVAGDCARCKTPPTAFNLLLRATKRCAIAAHELASHDPKAAAALLNAATGAFSEMMRLCPTETREKAQ